MKRIYIAGPFTADNRWDLECNIGRAEAVALQVARCCNAVPVCPHSMYRDFEGTMTPEFWYEATEELLACCYAMIVVGHWWESKGCLRERAYADAHGIPVFEDVHALAVWLDEQAAGQAA